MKSPCVLTLQIKNPRGFELKYQFVAHEDLAVWQHDTFLLKRCCSGSVGIPTQTIEWLKSGVEE